VNDHIAIVEQHPAGVGCSLNARLDIVLACESLIDGFSDRLELAFAAAGANDEVIRNAVQPPQIEQDDIAGLFVFGERHCPSRDFCRLYSLFLDQSALLHFRVVRHLPIYLLV
jgi:hypothetical protein